MECKSSLQIEQLTEREPKALKQITEWMYDWWGKKEGYRKEAVYHMMSHSICTSRIPQTYLAKKAGILVGMFQISVHDLDCRPDLYPWLCNVYVAEEYRGQGVFSQMMRFLPKCLQTLGIQKLFLFTEHDGLYERYGWDFEEKIETFLPDAHWQRLYSLSIKSDEFMKP